MVVVFHVIDVFKVDQRLDPFRFSQASTSENTKRLERPM